MLSDDLGWQHSYKRAFGVTYRSQLVMELSLLLEDGIIVQPLARTASHKESIARVKQLL